MPLIYLAIRVAQTDGTTINEVLTSSRTVQMTGRSVLLAAAVCATCVILGVLSAWLVTSVELPGRRAWLIVSAMPLAVPSYVAAFGWLSTFPGMQGFGASWLVLSAVCVPYVTLPVAAALRSADRELVDIARALGRGPFGAWRSAMLPQLSAAGAAGALLVALYVLSDFGAVSIFRLPVFTVGINRQYGSFLGRETAAVLAAVLVVLAIGLVLLERRLRGRAQRWRVGAGVRRAAPRHDLGPWRWPAVVVLCVAPFVAVVLPLTALVQRLAQGTSRALDPGELAGAVLNTAAVGAISAVVALALALPIGLLAARHRGSLVSTIEAAGYTGHALPGIVVALALVFLSLRVVPELYQSLTLLVFAYAVLFLPKGIGASRAAIAQVSPGLPEAARSLGRGPVAALVATTWRLAGPGIATGALLIMLTVMKELPATLLLRPTGMDTLATELWSRTNAAAFGAAAPYALALVALSAVPTFLLTRAGAPAEEVEP